MAWSDEPTDAQVGALYHFIRWKMPDAEAIRACEWLRENTTRREVSYELNRVRRLYLDHKLTLDRCFEGDIWEGYTYERS